MSRCAKSLCNLSINQSMLVELEYLATMPLERQKNTGLSRDERLRFKVLCEAGFTQEVATHTGATISQV
jgi:hypothetical protein